MAHRLNVRHIVHEAVHVFTHADKGIFSLIPMVLFRPGILALQYVEGKRKRYFSIFQYLILIVGVVTFIMAKTDFMENMAEAINPNLTKSSARVQAVQHKWMSILQQYFNLFLFAMIPIFSFFSWLFFRSRRYNYAENFVLQAAIQAQINTYSLFLVLPMAFFSSKEFRSLVVVISMFILIVSYAVANRQFFKVSVVQALFKGLLVYICTYIIFIIVIFISIIILIMQYEK